MSANTCTASPSHSKWENDAGDGSPIAGPSNFRSDDQRVQIRKRRRVSLESDPSDGDRFIASRSVSTVDPHTAYKKDVLDCKMGNNYLRVTYDGRMFVYGNATQMQMRYQNVLSSVAIPSARNQRDSNLSTSETRRRGLTRSRSKIFSYFSSSSSVADTISSPRTPLLESTDAPKFRPTSWSDETMRCLKGRFRSYRPICPVAYKVLDAPELEDNFYLNLVDWGKNDKIAVALKHAVYMYDVERATVEGLDAITSFGSERLHAASVKWIGDGSRLAWGNRRGDLTVYDTGTKQRIRQYTGQLRRIGVIDALRSVVATGSGDSTILIRDVRLPRPVSRITGHSNEVCGLKFSPFDDLVLASGGNDNKLFIWDLRKTSSSSLTPGHPVHRGRLSTTPFTNLTNPPVNEGVAVDSFGTASDHAPISEKSSSTTTPGPLFHLTEHRAAVRGLAWSPHTRGLLASGGGRQDPVIRFWNTSIGYKIDQLQCHAQVTNLSWSSTTDELLSTHGFPHQVPPPNIPSMPGVVTVWHYPTRIPNISFAAHNCRVSYLAVSPHGQAIATASGDETLRFFNLFPARSDPPNKTGEELVGRVR